METKKRTWSEYCRISNKYDNARNALCSLIEEAESCGMGETVESYKSMVETLKDDENILDKTQFEN